MDEKEQNCEENSATKEEKINENGEVNIDVSFFLTLLLLTFL